MSAKGKQWKLETLALSDISIRKDLQARVGGTTFSSVIRLKQALKNGETLPPIKAARIGDKVYLVDGHHRLEAHHQADRATITAMVARMSLAEAREEARKANANHGKPLSRKDKQAIWAAFVAEGSHLTEWGTARPAVDIYWGIGRIWTTKTIRKWLRKMEVELDEGDELHPVWQPRDDEDEDIDEGALAKRVLDEVGEGAREGLGLFLRNYNQVPACEQERLLEQAEKLVEALRRGQRLDEVPGLLDI